MSNKINSVKEKLISDYIKKIDIAIENYNLSIEPDDEIFDLLIEIINVLEKDIPNLQGSLLIRTGTEIIDANTAKEEREHSIAHITISFRLTEKHVQDTGV